MKYLRFVNHLQSKVKVQMRIPVPNSDIYIGNHLLYLSINEDQHPLFSGKQVIFSHVFYGSIPVKWIQAQNALPNHADQVSLFYGDTLMNLSNPRIEIDYGSFAKIESSHFTKITVNGQDLTSSFTFLSNKKVKLLPTALSKSLEVTLAYKFNDQDLIDSTQFTLSIFDGSSLFKQVQLPITLRKNELTLQQCSKSGNVLKMQFMFEKFYFDHIFRVRTNKGT